MGKKPKVSIIMPNYNYGKYIGAAIESCLNQTYSSLEVIVCDDGSNDNSEKVVKSFKDSRVIWLPGYHSGGPAVPRNRGIKNARGEWLAFLDSDDIWLPSKLEVQLNMLNGSRFNACCTNALIKINGVVTRQRATGWNKSTLNFRTLMKNNHIVCSSTMIHRSLIPIVRGFVEDETFKSFADYNFWLRVSSLSDFLFIKNCLVIYRDEPKISIRKDDYGSELVYQAVRNNFIKWADSQKDNSPFLNEYINILTRYSSMLNKSYSRSLRQYLGRLKNVILMKLLICRFMNILANKDKSNLNLLSNNFELISIAFNNVDIIKNQVAYLRKNLKDKYHLTIADNSSNNVTRGEIKSFCRSKSISYLPLPRPLLNFNDPSFSHGAALNWIYKYHLKDLNVKYFGFIDHDISPMRPTKITLNLEKNSYWGLIQERGDRWYLWAGFCFYRKEVFEKYEPNFLPSDGLDTGGGNWFRIYSKNTLPNNLKLDHYYIRRSDFKKVNSFDEIKIKMLLSKNQIYEMIGDWRHTFGGSGWRETKR